MKLEDYYRLVRKYEDESKKSPNRFRLRVFAITLAGYLVIWAIFLALTAALVFAGFAIWKNGWSWGLAAVLVVTVGLWLPALRCFTFRSQTPAGIELPPGQFPWLYQQLKMLRKPMKTGFKRIHLLVDWEYNASAIHIPRFGFLGPRRYYIRIGLPLLAILNTQQLRSIIAHELAHFSVKQNKLSHWIWKVRVMWLQFLTDLEGKKYTGWIFRWFANWYSHYFEASSNVLGRQFEYEADKLAAEAVGAECCAETLLRIDSRIKIVEDFWEELWRKPFDEEKVEKSPITLLIKELTNSLDPEENLQATKRMLGNDTLFFDSHPCLPDRLRNLGIPLPDHDSEIPSFIEKYKITKDFEVLSSSLMFDKRRTECFMDMAWGIGNLVPWVMRHLEGESLLEALKRLEKEEAFRGETLGTEKLWKKAWLKSELYGLDEAMPVVQQILQLAPDHAGANFLTSKKMLDSFDATGVVHLETAIENDPLAHRQQGLQLLADFYRRMGSLEEAEATLSKSISAGDECEEAERERAQPVRFFNKLSPHQLTEDQVEDLKYSFAAIPEVKKVYVVCKQVKHLPETPFHIIGIVPSFGGAINLIQSIGSVTKSIAFTKSMSMVIFGLKNLLLLLRIKMMKRSLIYNKNTSDQFKYSMD